MLAAGNTNGTSLKTLSITTQNLGNYVTPISPTTPNIQNFILPTPPMMTEKINYYNHLTPVKPSFPKYIKTLISNNPNNSSKSLQIENSKATKKYNITIFTPEDFEAPFKVIQAETSLEETIDNSNRVTLKPSLGTITKITSHDLNTLFSKPKYVSSSKIHDVNDTPEVNYATKITPLYFHGHENPLKKVPISQMNNLNFFLPIYDKKSELSQVKSEIPKTQLQNEIHQSLFKPKLNISSDSPMKVLLHSQIDQNMHREYNIHSIYGKHVTPMHSKDYKIKEMETDIMKPQKNSPVLIKKPNPYETVLLRNRPNNDPNKHTTLIPYSNQLAKSPAKSHSALDLENLISQMEIESEVNKNLGRSAGKNNRNATAAGQ